jgi:hypothetical protein
MERAGGFLAGKWGLMRVVLNKTIGPEPFLGRFIEGAIGT